MLQDNEYLKLFKSIIDQDKQSVVICNLDHVVVYMNPAATESYSKHGGESLVGQNIFDCHNSDSVNKIKQVVDWFKADPQHNLVYTFFNKKKNYDVYMIALRDGDELIGYYEKHEPRDGATMTPYDLW